MSKNQQKWSSDTGQNVSCLRDTYYPGVLWALFVFCSKTNKIYVYCRLNLCFVETGCHHIVLTHLMLCRTGWPCTSYADQADLKLTVILLPLLPKSWDYRCAKWPLLNCHTNFSKGGGVCTRRSRIFVKNKLHEARKDSKSVFQLIHTG